MTSDGGRSATVIILLERVLRGSLWTDEFQQWLAQIIIGDVEICSQDAPLVAQVIDLFEDDSIRPDRQTTLAERYALFLQSALSNSDVAEIYPVLAMQERLCEMVQKWVGEELTRTSFVSFLNSSLLSASMKDQLLGASPGYLAYLCEALSSSDYEGAIRLSRLSPDPP